VFIYLRLTIEHPQYTILSRFYIIFKFSTVYQFITKQLTTR